MARVKKAPNALGVLVDQICDANGWSRREVADRAKAAGHELSHQRISQMCGDDPLPGIQGDKIHALAVGLRTSPVRIALAAMAAMGVPVSNEDISPAEAIMRDPHLSEDTKQALLAILRGASERRRGA